MKGDIVKKPGLFILALLIWGSIVPTEAGVDILMLVPDKYGANFNFIHDRMESYGWNVVTAAVADTVRPCNTDLPVLIPDTLIREIVNIDSFEAIAITSARWRYNSNPYGDLIECPEAISLLHQACSDGIPVWSTCAGPRILAAADLLEGVNMQGTPGLSDQYLQEYLAAGAVYLGEGLPPVIDGNIITTTRGQYYQSENCEAIATVLADSRSAHWPVNGSIESTEVELPEADWSRTYGGPDSDGGKSLCETLDGGFMITGYTWSAGAGESDVLLVRTDQNGELIWTKTLGGSGWDCGNSVCLMEDGGFAVAGTTTSSGYGNRDMYLARLDSYGNTIWTRTYGGSGVDAGMSVCPDGTGGLAICGYTESSGSGENDVFILRIDSNGDVLWEKTFGGSGPETGNFILPDGSSGFVIAGSTGSYTDNRDAFLLRIDGNGELIWSNYYGAEGGEGGYDRATSLCITNDGGYVLTGESNGEDFCGAFLVRTDSLGTSSLTECYGSSFYDYGRSVTESSDGGLLICGSTKNSDNCENDIYIFKTCSDGQLVWEETFGTEDKSEWGCAICPTSDGRYAILGQTESFGEGNFDVWLIKTGDTAQGVEEPNPENLQFSVMPNPAKNSVFFQNPPSGSATVNIFDMGGRLVKTAAISPGEESLNISDLSQGVFLARIVTETESVSGSFIKLN
ncbi:MAG: T9SS type A sorting domain-containing protein [Candidatus Aegiribacteria sp.]|nr:T9SS type A sorting domain-containing protein [Candidatus Aegiribacteria sp.]